MSNHIININKEKDQRRIIENKLLYLWISLKDKKSILLGLYYK